MIAGISAVRMRLHVVSKSGRLRIWLGWRISLASKQLGWDGFIIPWFLLSKTTLRAFKDRTSANMWQIDFTHSVICASVGSLVRKASSCVTWSIWKCRDAGRRRKLTISWQMSQMRSFSWGTSSAAKLAATNRESKTKTWTHHGDWPYIQNSPSSCPSWRNANTQFKGTLVTSPISSVRPCFIVTRFSVEEYTGVIEDEFINCKYIDFQLYINIDPYQGYLINVSLLLVSVIIIAVELSNLAKSVNMRRWVE